MRAPRPRRAQSENAASRDPARGGEVSRAAIASIIRCTKEIVGDYGYKLHQDRKLQIRRRHDCQRVTGLVVNARAGAAAGAPALAARRRPSPRDRPAGDHRAAATRGLARLQEHGRAGGRRRPGQVKECNRHRISAADIRISLSFRCAASPFTPTGKTACINAKIPAAIHARFRRLRFLLRPGSAACPHRLRGRGSNLALCLIEMIARRDRCCGLPALPVRYPS